MNKRAQDRIDRIMSDAFDQAAQVLDAEWQKLLRARPDRYSFFVLAVGWGPTLFDVSGKTVEAHEKHRCCAKAKQLLDYSVDFYDRFGGDNRKVYADRVEAA